MQETYIYVLRDPRCLSIRYVGKSNRPKRRRWDHCSRQSNASMRTWVASLKAAALVPAIEIIEACPESQWQEREIYWVQKFKEDGHCLLNHTVGGNGTGCHLPETIVKMKAIQNMPARRQLQAKVARDTQLKNPELHRKQIAGFRKWMDTPEARAANGLRLKECYLDPVFVAKRLAAIRAANCKPVLKTDPSTGEQVGSFNSFQEAAASVPVSRVSMSRALRTGRPCRGYLWTYADGFAYKPMPRSKPSG